MEVLSVLFRHPLLWSQVSPTERYSCKFSSTPQAALAPLITAAEEAMAKYKVKKSKKATELRHCTSRAASSPVKAVD